MSPTGEIPHLQLPVGEYTSEVTYVPEEFLEGKRWTSTPGTFTVSDINKAEKLLVDVVEAEEPEVEKRDVSVNVKFVTLDRQFLSIPNAKAVATNKETGDTFEFVMSGEGEIPHLQLPLGDYELKITEVPEEFLNGKNYEDWKTVTKSFTVTDKNVGETIRFYEKEPEELEDYVLNIFKNGENTHTSTHKQVTYDDFWAYAQEVIRAEENDGWVYKHLDVDNKTYNVYLVKEEPVENPYYALEIYKDGELTQASEYGEIDYATFWAGAQATINGFVDDENLEYKHLDVENEEGTNRVVYKAYLVSKEDKPVELEDYKLHIYHYSELVETRDYDQVTLEDFDAAVSAAIEQAIAEGWVEDILVKDGNEYHLYLVKEDSEEDPTPEELNDYKLHIYHYSELVETKDYDQVTLEDFDAAVAAVIEQAIAEGWVEDILVKDGNEYHLYLVKVDSEEDPKPEDPKPEDPKPEDPKPEDPKPEDPKPEDPKPEDQKPENPKPEDPKPENPKPEDPKPEYPKPEDPKPENPKPEDPKPENPKPGKPAGKKSELPETGEAFATTIFGAAALSVLAGLGLVAKSREDEEA